MTVLLRVDLSYLLTLVCNATRSIKFLFIVITTRYLHLNSSPLAENKYAVLYACMHARNGYFNPL